MLEQKVSYSKRQIIPERLKPSLGWFGTFSGILLTAIFGAYAANAEYKLLGAPDEADWAWKFMVEYWPNKDNIIASILALSSLVVPEIVYNKLEAERINRKRIFKVFA
jgi:hypothetical protein